MRDTAMMRSLRSRLLLAFSLVALLPLLIAMAVLTQRIRASVRAQADERLAATAALLRTRIDAERARTAERLALIAGDPALKRLILVEPPQSPATGEALAEQRFLLGLDLLMVADTSGRVLGEAASVPGQEPPLPATAIAPLATAGTTMVPALGRRALVAVASVPVRYQGATVARLIGGTSLDSTWLAALARTSGIDLTLRDAGGGVVATTVSDENASLLSRRVALGDGAAPTLTVLASTAIADRAVSALAGAAVVLGALGLLLAIGLALLWSRQISRPVERLAAFSQRIAQGDWDEPLALASVTELSTLAAALERMREDLGRYRERLRVSERHAAWSQMARQVAHEIKNPLTPIAVSVADLRRSYEQRRADFPQILDQAVRTIGDEVESLKRLLQSFSELGRMPEPKPERCALDDLLGDLRTLYAGEIASGRLAIARSASLQLTTDRAQLRQALVNLIQNGLEALDGAGRVSVAAVARGDAVEIAVADDGHGIDAAQRARLFTPGFTTRERGSGLGLTIVQRIVHDLGGTVSIDPPAARGATFRVRLPLSPGTDPCPRS
jgi:two-component system, NtrC family, nitrogen regulation sensor histidine kinase NtrY